MSTPTIAPEIIERHVRNAHALRSRAFYDALRSLPAALRRAGHAVAGIIA